jgi:hypothetical protein
MSTQSTDKTTEGMQAAIESQLRQRLAAEKDGSNPIDRVSLLCLACRGLTSGDARFCTHCGAAFNALVVPAAARREAV